MVPPCSSWTWSGLSVSEPRSLPPWPGQSHLWRSLERLTAAGRLPGAFLVVGMAGLPGLPYADRVADALLCDAPAAGLACGTCVACRLLRSGNHPERLDLAPEGVQVRMDAARAAVVWSAGRTPSRGERRVVRIDGADRLGVEAAVALLKSVEEPHSAVHWVLAAQAPGRISPALRSRCVAFPLRAVAPGEIEAWLVAAGVEPDRAREAAALSDGLPERALAAAGRPTAAGDAVDAVRAALRTALREGRIGGRAARAALERWALVDQARRRGLPGRLVDEAVAELRADLPA